jgi:hypothetical protein
MWHFLGETQDNLRFGSCVIAVSQVRNRLGTQRKKSASWRFADHFNLRLEFLRTEIQDAKYKLLINIASSRIAKPMRIVELPFIKGSGVDIIRDQLRCAEREGLIEKRGTWYYLKNEDGKIGPGESKAVRWLETHEEDRELIRSIIDSRVAARRAHS